jgi:poly(ADP-ribose) glycohydrolase ARH3
MAPAELSALMDKFVGGALGTFVGDALGREVEGWSPEMITLRYGLLEKMGSGRYTDDTEMMIGIMESLLEDPSFDPRLTAARFLANFHPYRGYGGRIYGVMARLAQGMQWDRAGTDSWGNGGAMRIAPLGLYFFDDRMKLVEATVLCTRITHRHPQGIAGAVAQALAVGLALEKGLCELPIDRYEFVETIVDAVKGIDLTIAQELGRIAELRSSGGLVDTVGQLVSTFRRDVSAIGAVPAAIGAFVLNGTFRDTLVTAVNCGGDTDTIGAMAGAIAGAYYGMCKVPTEWMEPLENGHKGKDYVRDLARKLAILKLEGTG